MNIDTYRRLSTVIHSFRELSTVIDVDIVTNKDDRHFSIFLDIFLQQFSIIIGN